MTGSDDGVSVSRAPAQAPSWGIPILAVSLVALCAISLYSYAIFHTLTEAFCIVVAATVFIITYNTRRLVENHYLVVVGTGFLSFVILGVVHTLAFKGVHLFPGFDNDLPTQAFIVQRFTLAISFLVAPLYIRRRANIPVALASVFVGVGLVLLSLLVWRNFPHMFVEPTGLTSLKKDLEVLLSGMFVAGGVLLWGRRASFGPRTSRMLVVALGCFVGSELSFTMYATPFAASNLVGHLFQVAAFWFTYRAVVATSLADPFQLLFREAADRQIALSDANVQLTALAQISDAAISTLDVHELVGALLDKLVDVMAADAAILMLAEPNAGLSTYAAVGIEHQEITLAHGEGFAGRIARSQQPEFVSDARESDLAASEIIRGERFVSMLGVPLVIADELIGVLQVDWRTQHRYKESDLGLLQVLADRFALALRNARLFEAEHRIAEVLQESLLAMPASVDGLEFSYEYKAALQTARVGGDFYDIFEVDDGRVGVVIGDVSGKGLEAAVLTSRVRDTIRAHALDQKSPCDVMRLTNRVVDRSTDDATFVTVFFGVLDLRTGGLVYCNAGHATAVVIRATGGLHKMPAHSPIVGAFDDSAFDSVETTVQPGDVLFLYTDGAIEARRGSELFGEDRLFALLAAHTNGDPHALTRDVMNELSRFTGNALVDDVALLALRRTSLQRGGAVEPTT